MRLSDAVPPPPPSTFRAYPPRRRSSSRGFLRYEKYFMSQIAKCENVTSQVAEVAM